MKMHLEVSVRRLIKTLFVSSFLFTTFICCNGNGKNPGNKTPDKPDTPTSKKIVITSVTLDGKNCPKDGTVVVDNAEADLIVTFKEKYEELNVTVNQAEARMSGDGKQATFPVKNLGEVESPIAIVATAKNKINEVYSFNACAKADEKKIVITSVTLDGKNCPKDGTVAVENAEADLIVTFKEKYEELNVTVNQAEARMSGDGKQATFPVKNLGEVETPIAIVATAKNKNNEVYTFNAHIMGTVSIDSLVFIGDNINPTAVGVFERKKVTYSSDPTKPPLLSDITADGSTNIGTTKSFELEVWVKFQDIEAKEKMLKVENTTNNKNVTTTEIKLKTLQTKIPLKPGDNSLVITYSEKDKKPITYRLMVSYEEPPYEPIYKIEIADKFYANQVAFDKLLAGTETMNFEGAPKLPIRVTMKDVWYQDEGWTLKLDDEPLSKDKFERLNTSTFFIVDAISKLDVNREKTVKITFENQNRGNYLKEYKIKVTHKLLHKLEDFLAIEDKTNLYLTGYKFGMFKKDANKENQFNLDYEIKVSDWTSKILFLFKSQTESVKYALLTTEEDPASLEVSKWQTTEKKTIKYMQYTAEKEDEGWVAVADIPHGKSYLHVLLEGENLKVFYNIKIVREKVGQSDVYIGSTDILPFNTDDEGNILPNRYPLSTKGLIKFRPKNPRSKVKILAPDQKTLDINQDGTYYEYSFVLTGKMTTVQYQIVSEDTLHHSNNKTINLFKDPPITNIKFAYEPKTSTYGMKKANIKEGEYYIPVVKKDVKENSLYLLLEVFKGVKISSTELPQGEFKEGSPSDTYKYTLDVSKILDESETIKDYTGGLTLDGKNAGSFKFHLFKANEDIKEIKVVRFLAAEFPNNEYIFTKKMATAGEDIHIVLHKIDGETKDNSRRMIKIVHKDNEKILEITKDDIFEKALYFTLKSFKLADGEDAELTIKYYKNKTDSSEVPKVYKLTINNRNA